MDKPTLHNLMKVNSSETIINSLKESSFGEGITSSSEVRKLFSHSDLMALLGAGWTRTDGSVYTDDLKTPELAIDSRDPNFSSAVESAFRKRFDEEISSTELTNIPTLNETQFKSREGVSSGLMAEMPFLLPIGSWYFPLNFTETLMKGYHVDSAFSVETFFKKADIGSMVKDPNGFYDDDDSSVKVDRPAGLGMFKYKAPYSYTKNKFSNSFDYKNKTRQAGFYPMTMGNYEGVFSSVGYLNNLLKWNIEDADGKTKADKDWLENISLPSISVGSLSKYLLESNVVRSKDGFAIKADNITIGESPVIIPFTKRVSLKKGKYSFSFYARIKSDSNNRYLRAMVSNNLPNATIVMGSHTSQTKSAALWEEWNRYAYEFEVSNDTELNIELNTVIQRCPSKFMKNPGSIDESNVTLEVRFCGLLLEKMEENRVYPSMYDYRVVSYYPSKEEEDYNTSARPFEENDTFYDENGVLYKYAQVDDIWDWEESKPLIYPMIMDIDNLNVDIAKDWYISYVKTVYGNPRSEALHVDRLGNIFWGFRGGRFIYGTCRTDGSVISIETSDRDLSHLYNKSIVISMFHKEGKVHFLISERRGLDADGNKRPSIIEYEMPVQNDVLSVLHFLGHYTDKEDAESYCFSVDALLNNGEDNDLRDGIRQQVENLSGGTGEDAQSNGYTKFNLIFGLSDINIYKEVPSFCGDSYRDFILYESKDTSYDIQNLAIRRLNDIFSIKTANAGGLTYWDYPSGEGHSITTNPNKETVMKSGLFKEVSIYC